MSKRFIASVTLTAFSCLAVPVAAMPGDKSSAQVTSSGRVLVKQDGQWSKGSQQITPGATVRTAADGTAVVALPGGSLVRLAPNSQIAFEKVSDKGVVVNLERGRVIGQTSNSLQIRTDLTSTQASAGEFVINTSKEGTRLDVLSGNASLSSLDETSVTLGEDGKLNSDLASQDLKDVQIHEGKEVAQGEAQDPVKITECDHDHDKDEKCSHSDDANRDCCDVAEAGGVESNAAQTGSGGSNFPVAAAGIGVGGVILLLLLSSGDDNEGFSNIGPVPPTPPVPSPSLP